jgi:hypothetical protein
MSCKCRRSCCSRARSVSSASIYPAHGRPQALGQPQGAQHEVSVRARGAPVAVDERVDPGKAMVRAGGADDRLLHAGQRCVEVCPAVHQTVDLHPRGCEMTTGCHIAPPMLVTRVTSEVPNWPEKGVSYQATPFRGDPCPENTHER